jgi:hypothetical protein
VESAALMENPAGFTTGLGQVFDLPTLTTALLRNFFYQTFLNRDRKRAKGLHSESIKNLGVAQQSGVEYATQPVLPRLEGHVPGGCG